jgi:RNA polymerase sigma factor (TIGR02999 family)
MNEDTQSPEADGPAASGGASVPDMSLEEMYAALRRIAQAAMRGERSSHTLQPTALVHEYLLALPEGLPESPADRVAVVRKAGWRMRRYLIDYARQRQRHHPESVAAQRVALEAVDGDNLAVTFPDLELLDDLLRELQVANAEAAAVVEMRFFCGLKQEEVAKALEVSVPTVERRWREAREWLQKRIVQAEQDGR